MRAGSRPPLIAPAGLTRAGEKLRPANFIAPKMRSADSCDRGERADVYSLAKTLFVLAHPRRRPYPPDGTHRVDAKEFSLWDLIAGELVVRAVRGRAVRLSSGRGCWRAHRRSASRRPSAS